MNHIIILPMSKMSSLRSRVIYRNGLKYLSATSTRRIKSPVPDTTADMRKIKGIKGVCYSARAWTLARIKPVYP